MITWFDLTFDIRFVCLSLATFKCLISLPAILLDIWQKCVITLTALYETSCVFNFRWRFTTRVRSHVARKSSYRCPNVCREPWCLPVPQLIYMIYWFRTYWPRELVHPSTICTDYPTQLRRKPGEYPRGLGSKAGDTLDGRGTNPSRFTNSHTPIQTT